MGSASAERGQQRARSAAVRLLIPFLGAALLAFLLASLAFEITHGSIISLGTAANSSGGGSAAAAGEQSSGGLAPKHGSRWDANLLAANPPSSDWKAFGEARSLHWDCPIAIHQAPLCHPAQAGDLAAASSSSSSSSSVVVRM